MEPTKLRTTITIFACHAARIVMCATQRASVPRATKTHFTLILIKRIVLQAINVLKVIQIVSKLTQATTLVFAYLVEPTARLAPLRTCAQSAKTRPWSYVEMVIITSSTAANALRNVTLKLDNTLTSTEMVSMFAIPATPTLIVRLVRRMVMM